MILLAFACRTVFPADGTPGGAPVRWDRTLRAVVSSDGRVDYDALEAQRQSLDDFVVWLEQPAAFKGRISADRHAFWINAYNALTLYQVLERGRPSSVMDVAGVLPLAGSGFFLETAFDVGGEYVSLSEIEHERLRMKEYDYRDHAALNCASGGCPPLRAGLYTQEALPHELDEAMARWVNDPARGVRVDDELDLVWFSPIFEWYGLDFTLGDHEDSLCALTAGFADPVLASRLRALDARGCPHRYTDYDWNLNQAH